MDYFEKQKLNNKFIATVFAMMVMGILFGLIIFMRKMVTEGLNWYVSLASVLIFFLAITLGFYIIFQSELETSVDKSGFKYRYFPFIRKTRLIDFHEIKSWKIGDKKELFFKAAPGYKRSLLRKRTSIILDGDEYLEIILNTGGILLFSTTNYFSLSSALRKYASEKELD